MNNTEFKTKYQEELNELKAPTDLIAKTKQAVAAEEKKAKDKKNNNRYLYSSLATVAAAFVLFAGVMGFMHIQKDVNITQDENAVNESQTGQGDTLFAEDDSLNGTTIFLGENKGEIYLEEEIEIDKTSILPIAFLSEGAWEEDINGKTVKFAVEENGYYIAAYEEKDSYVVIYSQLTQADAMKECVEKIVAP